MKQSLVTEKMDMNANELSIFETEFRRARKSGIVLWLLWLFTGSYGGHRYYLGNWGRAIAHSIVFVLFLILGISFNNHLIETATIDVALIAGPMALVLFMAVPNLWAIADAFFIGRRLAARNLQIEKEIIDQIKNARTQNVTTARTDL